MSDHQSSPPNAAPGSSARKVSRRSLLAKLGLAGTATAFAGATTALAAAAADDEAFRDAVATYFQDHYVRMTKEEVEQAIARLERKAKRDYDVNVRISNHPPIQGVLFGYALNISKCKGYRKCVYACVEENNITRHPQTHYIRVLEMDKGSMDLEHSDHYYNPEGVPQKGKFYLPISCQHCENPPCVRACPTQATWKEPDGIVVVDYNWCIGCHYCVVACPYWARRFNPVTPSIPKDKFNTDTHYLSNRPRMRGVIEKCTFCINRTRQGKLPACMEACPTGARVFGNLLDPNSEISRILREKTVFRLKEDLNTEPKFWYYTD